MNRRLIAIAACAVAGGCGVLKDARSGCDEPQPYEAAGEAAPLKVPPGSDAPDTRNALRIPQVPAPKHPREPGRCLDYPPASGGARSQGG